MLQQTKSSPRCQVRLDVSTCDTTTSTRTIISIIFALFVIGCLPPRWKNHDMSDECGPGLEFFILGDVLKWAAQDK